MIHNVACFIFLVLNLFTFTNKCFYMACRYLGKLKSFVRNRAYPEASMANSFLADECMVFCSRYIEGFSTKLNKPSRNDDSLDQIDSNLHGHKS